MTPKRSTKSRERVKERPWCVLPPGKYGFCYATLSVTTRKASIREAEILWATTWAHLKSCGYRCVRVTITEEP